MKGMLVNFMKKIGKDSEFKLFLELMHKAQNYAVIKVSGKSLEDNMDLIAEDIAFLNKLDIYPIVVHGCGSLLDKTIPSSKKINGVRYTSKEDMAIVAKVASKVGAELCDKINLHGGKAQIAKDVFYCTKMENLGYVGSIVKVDKSKLSSNKSIILSPLGILDSNELVNINADNATKAIVEATFPKKLIFITETGGVLDESGKLLSFLNVFGKKFPNIDGGMLLKVKAIQSFLKDNPDIDIAITSAENLLKEMFTIKGGGTFIKYYVIKSSNDLDAVPGGVAKVQHLLEDAFGKSVVPGSIEKDFKEIFYQKDMEGIVIMKSIDGMPYLDKFAVAKYRQGTGLGQTIWDTVCVKYPKFMWRALTTNPLNSFYMKNCDGMVKADEWIVFWIGIDKKEAILNVDRVAALPKSMI